MKNKLISCVFIMFILSIASCKAQISRSGVQKNESQNIGGISPIRGMNHSRAAHTAVLLNNGKVLITGGFSGDKNGLASAEIFDSKTNTFSSGGNMSVARASHSATLLPNGKVLLAGGFNGEYLDSAEIYDPQTGRFTSAGKMTMPRSGHIAVLLESGKVLLSGGVGTNWTFLADSELYDPATGTFTKTGMMTTARESHTATLLKDGRVLITGGHQGRRSAIEIYRSAEIYDPQTGKFSSASDLTVKRHKHDAVLLNDGRVLIVGGSDERDSRGAYTNVEIYDPKKNRFDKIGEMNLSRYKLQGTTILLKNGKVLIGGGANRAEIFDPQTNSFEIAPGTFETIRLFSTATLLPDGQVLIVGGYDHDNEVNSSAWIYKS